MNSYWSFFLLLFKHLFSNTTKRAFPPRHHSRPVNKRHPSPPQLKFSSAPPSVCLSGSNRFSFSQAPVKTSGLVLTRIRFPLKVKGRGREGGGLRQWQQEGPSEALHCADLLQAAGRCWRATMNDKRKEERKSPQSGIVDLTGFWHKGAQTQHRQAQSVCAHGVAAMYVCAMCLFPPTSPVNPRLHII